MAQASQLAEPNPQKSPLPSGAPTDPGAEAAQSPSSALRASASGSPAGEAAHKAGKVSEAGEANKASVSPDLLQPQSPKQTLSEADVRSIATYARIGLDAAELTAMTVYLNEAIALLAPIVTFDPKDTDPTFHPIGELSNVMREDAPRPGLALDAALENAHATEGRFFRVPSILGGGGLS